MIHKEEPLGTGQNEVLGWEIIPLDEELLKRFFGNGSEFE